MPHVERLQVREEARAQVEDHALARVHHDLRVDHRDHLVGDLEDESGAENHAEQCRARSRGEGLVAAAIQPGIGRPDRTLSTTSFKVHGVSAPRPTSASDTTASSARRHR